MNKKINILDTEYKLIYKSEKEETRLEKNWGFCDFYTKEIYIYKDIEKETDDSCKNLKYFKNKVIRHEILHAFLYESGLRENTIVPQAWAENEEMVDWFAIQSPKLFKIYKELDILD